MAGRLRLRHLMMSSMPFASLVGLGKVGAPVAVEDALEVVPARGVHEHGLAQDVDDARAAVVEPGAAYVLAQAVVEAPRARVDLPLGERPGSGVADGPRPVADDDLGPPSCPKNSRNSRSLSPANAATCQSWPRWSPGPHPTAANTE